MHTLKPPFSFFASLRLAVFVILGIATISAVGTITEARYDAEVAQKLVYQSPYMYAVMGLLIINLIAVMIDRWPWRQHHAGFVMAHIGIITLLFGAWLTQEFGVDGSLAFAAGESRNSVVVKDSNFSVYASLDGSTMREMYSAPVDFLRHPPSVQKPYVVQLGQDQLRVVAYEHFAFRESEILPSEVPQDGPAIRFQLENANVNMTQWLRRESRRESADLDLGPAEVILTEVLPPPHGRNSIVLLTQARDPKLKYVIYNKDNSVRKRGQIMQSETLDTGWMGLHLRLLRYLPNAKEVVQYSVSPTASPLAQPALRFTFLGEEHWLGMDSAMRVYLKDRMYYVSFGHRQIELGFPLQLRQFRVGMYQGTERAASYESEVEVPSRGTVTISMNEPLQFKGYTFYQSSFERDERTGKPVISVLSVNRDPGRWVKYLGSLMIVLGSIILFYFKRVQWRRQNRAGSPG